jgi:hypothetical protein
LLFSRLRTAYSCAEKKQPFTVTFYSVVLQAFHYARMLVRYPGENQSELESLRLHIAFARSQAWTPSAWKPAYELRNKRNGLRSTVWDGKFDQEIFELISKSDHDHCGICWLTFSPAKGHLQEGWFNGQSWICNTCHRLFIQTNDPEAALAQLERV